MAVGSPDFWDEYYRGGRVPWDQGGPVPPFERLLETRGLVPGRMIVLGAGQGHDARLFARHGFEVTAVDFADEAVRAMHAAADPEAPVTVLQADIFALPDDLIGRFDYVLEYTCFCAIDPSRRADYAALVAQLLRPGGTLIALLFPVGEHEGGPPYAVSPEQYIRLLTPHGLTLTHRERPPDSVPARRGAEALLIFDRH